MIGDEVQVDNGEFTRIHHAILERLAKSRLNGQEFRALMFLFRKTYGWNKKEDAISLSQWQEGLGLAHRQHVYPILESLLQKKIIYRNKKAGLIWIYGFNKYFEEWEDGVTLQGYRGVTLEGDRCNPPALQKCNPPALLQKTIKDTLTKDNLKTSVDPVIPEKLSTENFLKTWEEWISYRKEIKHTLKPITQTKQLKMLERYSPDVACTMLDQSMTNGWQGIFEVKITSKNGNGHTPSIPTQSEAETQEGLDALAALAKKKDGKL